jgi:hypothetical protein
MLDPRGQLLRRSTRIRRVLDALIRSLAPRASDLAGLVSGIGHITTGMARQGYDLELTRYDDKGWRATFYTTGMEQSPTSATGTGGSARRGARRSAQVGGIEEGRHNR